VDTIQSSETLNYVVRITTGYGVLNRETNADQKHGNVYKV